MGRKLKLKDLEQALQEIEDFPKPKPLLEQYITPSHIAARALFSASQSYDDFDGKMVLDLGCGTAMLTAGCSILGAEYVLGVDADPDALAVARENLANLGIEGPETDLINAYIGEDASLPCLRLGPQSSSDPSSASSSSSSPAAAALPSSSSVIHRKFDTVVMNPPFGTKNSGIDMVFLKAAAQLSSGAIYSMHKSSTREFIVKKAKEFGLKAEVLAELKYDLKATYKFHKKKSIDIEVDFIRFVHV